MQYQPVEVAGRHPVAAAAEDEVRGLGKYWVGKLSGLFDTSKERRRTGEGQRVEGQELDVLVNDYNSGASQYSASLTDMLLRFAQSSTWSRPIFGMAK